MIMSFGTKHAWVYGAMTLITGKTFFAGRDFPSRFEKDLFSERRSGTCFTCGNPWDPESLISGAELAVGMTYANSKRNWGYTTPTRETAEALYADAVSGLLTPDEVLEIAPRHLTENMNERRLMGAFDNCPAVVDRNRFCVLLDRDKLPKFKLDGERYPLSCLRNRWIVYVDNHPRFLGEYDALRSLKAARELFGKRG